MKLAADQTAGETWLYPLNENTSSTSSGSVYLTTLSSPYRPAWGRLHRWFRYAELCVSHPVQCFELTLPLSVYR